MAPYDLKKFGTWVKTTDEEGHSFKVKKKCDLLFSSSWVQIYLNNTNLSSVSAFGTIPSSVHPYVAEYSKRFQRKSAEPSEFLFRPKIKTTSI